MLQSTKVNSFRKSGKQYFYGDGDIPQMSTIDNLVCHTSWPKRKKTSKVIWKGIIIETWFLQSNSHRVLLYLFYLDMDRHCTLLFVFHYQYTRSRHGTARSILCFYDRIDPPQVTGQGVQSDHSSHTPSTNSITSLIKANPQYVAKETSKLNCQPGHRVHS